GMGEKVMGESRPGARFHQTALDALCAYSWPGNVRELKNTIMALTTLSDSDTEISLADLPPEITASTPKQAHTKNAIIPLGDLDSMERMMIENALLACDGDQGQAAERLGISRRTLTRKLKLYRLEDSCRTNSRDAGGTQHQRYFRAALDRVVTLRSVSGYEANARSVNVSLTGIGLHEVPETFPCGGIIEVL